MLGASIPEYAVDIVVTPIRSARHRRHRSVSTSVPSAAAAESYAV